MRSASMWLLCETRIIKYGVLLYTDRRKTFVDLVLEETRRRGRRHELAMDLRRNSTVLDQLAVAELDLQHLRLRVVTDRADLARIDALSFHIAPCHSEGVVRRICFSSTANSRFFASLRMTNSGFTLV